jgi:hypothetical protein
MKRRRTTTTDWKSAAARRVCDLAGAEGTSVETSIRLVVGKLLAGVQCPPTPLDSLCDRLGVTDVEDDDSLSVAGELRRDSRGYQIFCASGQPETRRRFTIAHELAHVVFEQGGPGCPRTGTELEQICDMIAAEILMPVEVFKRELESVWPNAAGISQLASKFRVSLTAMAIRCAEFQPISVFGVENGRIVWGRGPIRADVVRESLDGVMRQAFDVEPGDRLVFINTSRCRGIWEADWIRMSGDRSALFVLNRISATAARAALASK